MISAGEVQFAGQTQGHRRPESARHHGSAQLFEFSTGRRQSAGGGPRFWRRAWSNRILRNSPLPGVTLLGEVGLGSVKSGEEAQRMVAWARRYGIQSTIHTGGPSIPGSGLIDKDVVLEADADIIGTHQRRPHLLALRASVRAVRAVAAWPGDRS